MSFNDAHWNRFTASILDEWFPLFLYAIKRSRLRNGIVTSRQLVGNTDL